MKNRYVRHAHISEVIFRKVLKLFCADIPARTAAGLAGLSVQSTQSLYDGLRLRILALALEEARPFAGEVEIDESYFGARRVRGKRGRGAGGKTPVIGLFKRGGKVFTEIVENCSKLALMPIIKGQVLSESTVYTDGWKSYDGLVLGGYSRFISFSADVRSCMRKTEGWSASSNRRASGELFVGFIAGRIGLVKVGKAGITFPGTRPREYSDADSGQAPAFSNADHNPPPARIAPAQRAAHEPTGTLRRHATCTPPPAPFKFVGVPPNGFSNSNPQHAPRILPPKVRRDAR